MFNQLRRKIETKFYNWALNYICKRNSHYNELRQFLDNDSLSDAITRAFKGYRLTFNWEQDPDRGYAKMAANLYNSPNTLLDRIKKSDAFVGKVVDKPF